MATYPGRGSRELRGRKAGLYLLGCLWAKIQAAADVLDLTTMQSHVVNQGQSRRYAGSGGQKWTLECSPLANPGFRFGDERATGFLTVSQVMVPRVGLEIGIP